MADELNNGLVQGTEGHETEQITVAGLKAALQKFKTEEVDPMQWPMVMVEELPTASADTMHKIYLIPSTNRKTKNGKDEFITLDNGQEAETRYTWEQIGSTTVDLSGYATLQQCADAFDAVRAADVAVTTLSSAPTSSTPSYTKDGQTINFKIGDEVRVADAEQSTESAHGYVYYKLYDLVNGTAYWDLMGAGGGDQVGGTITVQLKAYVNSVADVATLLNGATITLTNTTDSQQVGETVTWAGQPVVFSKVQPLKNYRVTVTNPDSSAWDITSLYQDITSLDIAASEEVNFNYNQDKYTMAVNIAAGRIIIGGTEYANGETYGVAAGATVTPTAKTVANYVTPTATISGKTITADYVAYGVLTVNTTSNQGTDATIAAVSPTVKIGSAAAVTYSAPMPIEPDASVEVEWPAVTGYLAPSKQTFTMPSTDTTKSGEYQTEVLTISITKDDGEGDLTTCSIVVTDGQTTLGTLTNASPTLKIAYGVNYTCTPSALTDYIAPEAVTKDWADTTAKSLTFEYVEFKGYVDLGLPSGMKWAVGNIVPNVRGGYTIGEETDYGAYFSWGNTVPHFSTNGSTFDDGYDWGTANSGTYAPTPGASLTGDIQSNDAVHDAAVALLGSAWHMPNKDDFQELYDNTDNEWTTINGVAGWKFMKKSDHSIYVFFPAAGYGRGTSLSYRGSRGLYWSRSWNSADRAVSLYFYSSSVSPQNSSYRYYGYSVRAVQFPYTVTLNFKDSNNNNLVEENLVVTTPSGNVTVTTDSNGNATFMTVAGSHSVSSKNYQITTSTFTVSGNATVSLVADEGNYVDLGLPSGKLWAKGNIVQDGTKYKIGEESDYGAYFSWGNIVPHFSSNGSTFDDGYDWGTSVTGSPYSSTPGKTLARDIPLDATYDAAIALLGFAWHMPNKFDFQELCEYTDSTWTNIDGIMGRKFMKKSDHSVYVFFPAAGTGRSTSLNSRGSGAQYWSSSWYSDSYSYELTFDGYSGGSVGTYTRSNGFSVRPIAPSSTNITITLHSTDNISVSRVVLKITDSEGAIHTVATNSEGVAKVLDVAYGNAMVESVGCGFTPNTITVSASSKTFTLDMQAIQYAYVKINQTQSSEQNMVTVSETENGTAQRLQSTGKHANAALQALRDASHLYMGKASNGSMALRQLKDDDGTKYADDNSTADMTGAEGDHYLRINVPFFVKRVSGADSGDQVTFCLAVGGQPDGTGWKQIITPNDLLGVHEATATVIGNSYNGILRSISGGQSTGMINWTAFKNKASKTGKGFTMVTWEWHNIMTFLFYAWYGRTNAQAKCGRGADSYTRTLGTKDSLGMTDTTSSNGNTDNTKFWGIENWWGGKTEHIDNVVVDARVWKVTDKNGTTRTAGTGGSESGFITKMLLSENLDFIPTAASGGSATTYYCDYYYQSENSSCKVNRSGSYVDSDYAKVGISYTYATGTENSYGLNLTTRLAFNGKIAVPSVTKLIFKTSNDTAVAGAIISVTSPVGTDTYTTNANGEIAVLTLPGTCTLSCVGCTANINQFTAVAGYHTIDVTATPVPMQTGYIILDQTSSDPTTKVIDEDGHTYSNYTRPSVIDSIRAASHCYVGTFAGGKMYLKQLSDSDGTLYADGTSASADIISTSKSVFMRLPYFFTRVSTYATNKIKIEFAYDSTQSVTVTRQPDGTGWKKWGGNDLIGKYEGYVSSNYLYSISGQSSTITSQTNFKTYASNRGTGYSLVKWRHHNIMAILFYAYYGHTNCQAICGTGSGSSTRTTGLKDSLGMTDTTSSNGNTDNIVFWGLENWWGNKNELIDNVVVNSGTWTITGDDGTTRTINGASITLNSYVYPSKFILGDNLDVIAAAGQTGGSATTGYCDQQYVANSSSYVVARSRSYAYTDGGLTWIYVGLTSSQSSSPYGSRLAYTGPIEIV